MKPELLAKIVAEASRDPSFFHDLVFDPKKAAERADFLDEPAKAALLAVEPERVLGFAIGDLKAGCGGGETCSCTSATCGGTCGGSTCGSTCGADSCGRTCDNSCGQTSSRDRTLEERVLFARRLGGLR